MRDISSDISIPLQLIILKSPFITPDTHKNDQITEQMRP